MGRPTGSKNAPKQDNFDGRITAIETNIDKLIGILSAGKPVESAPAAPAAGKKLGEITLEVWGRTKKNGKPGIEFHRQGQIESCGGGLVKAFPEFQVK